MTGQQRRAFTHPCYEAAACTHPRFFLRRQIAGVSLSVAVTVNIGLE